MLKSEKRIRILALNRLKSLMFRAEIPLYMDNRFIYITIGKTRIRITFDILSGQYICIHAGKKELFYQPGSVIEWLIQTKHKQGTV